METIADQVYLHGDYLEPSDRSLGSTVYCGLCDGYCAPEHLYDDHEIEHSMQRLNAGKRALGRTRQTCPRPEECRELLRGHCRSVLNG